MSLSRLLLALGMSAKTAAVSVGKKSTQAARLEALVRIVDARKSSDVLPRLAGQDPS